MRKHRTEPLLFRDHVGVQSGHVFTGTSGHVVNIVQAIVQVSRFEVMWYSGELRSAFIKDVWKRLPHIFDGILESVGFAIIEEKHSEPIGRIVEITRRSDGVHDDVEIFTTAGDKHVDGRDVVAEQTQLWPSSLLHDEQRPKGLKKDGNGDTDFDGDKQPGNGKGGAKLLLGRDDKGDPQSKVQPIQGQRNETEDRRKIGVQPSPATSKKVLVISVMKLSDRSLFDPISMEICGRRIGDEWS